MSVSDFKDEIIRARQRGATYQAIANRYACSRQHIQQLLSRWGAKDVLVPTKKDRAREALQLLVSGERPTIEKAAAACSIGVGALVNEAKRQGVNLLQAKRHALRGKLNGQRFHGIVIVDDTYYLDHSSDPRVEGICMVCGARKDFRVSNLLHGYTKTCSTGCGRRYRKGDYPKG